MRGMELLRQFIAEKYINVRSYAIIQKTVDMEISRENWILFEVFDQGFCST